MVRECKKYGLLKEAIDDGRSSCRPGDRSFFNWSTVEIANSIVRQECSLLQFKGKWNETDIPMQSTVLSAAPGNKTSLASVTPASSASAGR